MLKLVLILSLFFQPIFVFGGNETKSDRDHIRLALLRGIPAKWEPEKNFAVVRAAIAAAAARGADLLITPEGWLDGYASVDPDSTPARLRPLAQPLDSSSYLREVSELTRKHGIWVCFGFISLENDKIYNSAGLWDANGKLI